MTSAAILEAVVHALVLGLPVVVMLAGIAAYASWWERKFSARMQNRLGPTVVGPMGILQPIADGLKVMQKESIIPRDADRPLFLLAPLFPMFLVIATAAVVPMGGGFDSTGAWSSWWVIADLDVGILWVLALAGLMIFPSWMAGWASNNKYTLLSAMRTVAQGVSYEIPMVFAALVPVIATGELSLSGIVAWQAEHGWLIWRAPVVGLVAFGIFFLSTLAEANRIPFDVPEAESELIAGVLVEYTGVRMAVFMLAEYIHTFLAGVLAAVLFLGGAHGPGPAWMSPMWLALKTLALFTLIYWIRWSWYRFRADQLMNLCWRWFVPICLLLVLGTGSMVAGGWL